MILPIIISIGVILTSSESAPRSPINILVIVSIIVITGFALYMRDRKDIESSESGIGELRAKAVVKGILIIFLFYFFYAISKSFLLNKEMVTVFGVQVGRLLSGVIFAFLLGIFVCLLIYQRSRR
ncbi:hypothetical protein ACES2I_08800 [Bdellovibrio bacteriovorus]|uniref:hypothetical protein n=1 Tax=Bdellovibrio bacteriovorus TaxID=959 RepID=UPI0035A5AD99